MEIVGAKSGGSGGGDTSNHGTEIASIAYMKMLFALSEGEVEDRVTGKKIYLNGTPLIDDNGVENFPDVTWEFRNGTQDQSYIKGFPAVENEISVGFDMKYGTPWVKSISNTQLSAVRLRVKFPSGVYSMRESGGKDGYKIEYAVEISTDGSTYTEIGRDAADGIANTGYERSYRIDLPAAVNGWQIRVRRLTAEKNDGRTAEAMRIESMTEIVDAKLSYPNTALLFIQFDSKLFDGQTPTVTVRMKGIRVRVPTNYDPIARTYTGAWDGTFKFAWTNNVVWQIYDLLLKGRYGTGKRLSADQVDKWSLYKIAQYQDAQVSNGMGGQEVRSMFDIYITSRPDAWQVLMDMVSSFQGMMGWSKNLLTVDADMPRQLDPDFVFSKANIVGSFRYSGSSERANYSAGIATYSNPENHFNDDQASTFVPDLSRRYGFNQLEMTAVGCTRESEAQRRLMWAILTNSNDNLVEFTTGQEGRIPRLGKIIGVNNAPLAGRSNGGRISAAAGAKITLDRDVQAKAGDRLIVNLPSGVAQSRGVKSVSGRGITVDSPFSETPEAEASWVLDQTDLAIELYRVSSITENDDRTITIAGIPYNPNKFARIDDGAIIEDRHVTVVPPRGQAMPKNIKITSSYRVNQGIGITTMEVTWEPVNNAIAYEAQWRQDNGNWINVGRTGNTLFTVDGIYSGRYVVRVRAVNALDITSMWATSAEVFLQGKAGKPKGPVALTPRSKVFGVSLSWGFPAGAEDALKTVLQYSQSADGANPLLLAEIPYPQRTYEQNGLRSGVRMWYRAQLVDKHGNASDFTPFVMGESSSDASEILSYLTDQINSTQLSKDLRDEIDNKATTEAVQTAVSEAKSEAKKQVDDARKEAERLSEAAKSDAVSQATEQVNAAKELAASQVAEALRTAEQQLAEEAQSRISGDAAEAEQRSAAVQAEARARADALLNEKNERSADITQVKTLIQNTNESLAEQISQIAAGSGEQFDTLNIWYFDTSNEQWTEDDSSQVPMQVTADGWLKAANSTATCRSPNNLAIDANAYRFIKLRIKKVGNPVWSAKLFWIGTAEQGWNDARSMSITEPEYDANGVATLTLHDIDWRSSASIRRFRFDFLKRQTGTDYVLIDWIAVGRPTPGAGMAALQDESSARVKADAAEAANRNTLAVQLRGAYEGNDLAKVSSGLIFSERQSRVTADEAEARERRALETSVNGSLSQIDSQLTTLTTATESNAQAVTGLRSDVDSKASAAALNSLTTRVTNTESGLTSQGSSITQINTALCRETTFFINARGNGAPGGLSTVTGMDGSILYRGSRSYNVVTFKTGSDGSTTIDSAQHYDVYASKDKGTALKEALAAMPVGEQVIIFTADEPRWNSASVADAVELIGGTASIVRNLKYRSAYIVIGRRGLPAGTAIELQSATANAADTLIDVPVTFRNGLIHGLGGGTGAAAATAVNASAIQQLSGRVTETEAGVTSASVAITKLQGGLESANTDIAKKADGGALQSLSNIVTDQGKTLSSQGSSITSMQNGISELASSLDADAAMPGNMLVNPSFERQFSRWTGNDTSWKILAAVTPVSGKNIAQCGPTGGVSRISQIFMAKAGRTYRIGVSVRRSSDLAIRDQNNTKLRLGNKDTGELLRDVPFTLTNLPTSSIWGTVTTDYRPSTDTGIDLSLSVSTSAGFIYFDDVFVFDITDAVAIDAQASAMSSLQNTVTQQGKDLVSQGASITSLQNSIKTTNDAVSKKADSSAVSSLQSTVTQQGKDIATANSSITNLQSGLNTANSNIDKKADATALNTLTSRVSDNEKKTSSQAYSITDLSNTLSQQSKRGANLLQDGTFESYEVGTDLAGGRVIVTSDDAQSGSKCIRVTRLNNYNPSSTDNNDNILHSGFQVRDCAVFYIEYYVKLDANRTDMAPSTQISVGLSIQYQDNSWSWPAIGKAVKDLSTTTWTKVYGYLSSNKSGVKRSLIRISVPNVTSVRAGDAFLIDNLVIVDVTDAYNAQQTADANAKAIQSISSSVEKNSAEITSQATALTKLNSELSTANSNISKKADASALTALTNRVTTAEDKVTSQSGQITALKNGLSAANTDLSKKADVSAVQSLSNTVKSQGDTLSSYGSRVTSIENNLTQGDNLIPNSTMLNNAQGWSGTAGTVDGYPSVSSTGAWAPTSPKFNVSPGDIIDMSLMCLAGATVNNLAWGIRFDGPELNNKTLYVGSTNYLSGDKKAISGSIEVPKGATTGFIQPSRGEAVELTIYNVDVTRRNAGTIANSKAITTLSGKVTQAEGDISSTNSAVTRLQSGLASANTAIGKKADSSAVDSLSSIVKQQGDKLTAQGNNLSSLSSTVDTNGADIISLTSTLATLDEAVSTQLETLSASSRNNAEASLQQIAGAVKTDANISKLAEVVANNELASAQKVETLTAQLNDTKSQVQTAASAIAKLDGSLSASYAVKVGITDAGEYYSAGFAMGISNETGSAQSQFLVTADTFAILPSTRGNSAQKKVSPFITSGDETYINTAIIKNGSIDNAKISNIIESSNYSTGRSGWRINKNGQAEFNSVTVRGTVFANAGKFSNIEIDESCTVKGTVYADKIIGDVVSIGVWGKIQTYGVNGKQIRYFNGGLPYETVLLVPSPGLYSGDKTSGAGSVYINVNGKRYFTGSASTNTRYDNTIVVNVPANKSVAIEFGITGAASGQFWGCDGDMAVMVFRKGQNRFSDS